MTRASSLSALVLAAVLAVAAGAAWRWRGMVHAREAEALMKDSWEEVHDRFPMPPERAPDLSLEAGTFEGVVRANPFSPLRRAVPLPREEAVEGVDGTPAQPGQPQLVYKGRIALGTKQRAIIENLTDKKTHFLEVGQEVAGFKVLDIAENRVVLSDEETRAEVVLSVATPSKP